MNPNHEARQAALEILAAMLAGDVPAALAKVGSCDPALVITGLALWLFDSLSSQGIPPAEWVGVMQDRPADEPGPAGGLAWQN